MSCSHSVLLQTKSAACTARLETLIMSRRCSLSKACWEGMPARPGNQDPRGFGAPTDTLNCSSILRHDGALDRTVLLRQLPTTCCTIASSSCTF